MVDSAPVFPSRAHEDNTASSRLSPNITTATSAVKRKASQELPHNDPEPATSATENSVPLSKNQVKKLRRQQLWEQTRADRKAKRKEKRLERTARRAAAISTLQSEKGLDRDAAKAALGLAASQRPRASEQRSVPVSLIIDCDFESYMSENEVVSLAGQVVRSYAMNRRGRRVAHLFVSSWNGKLRERFEGPLAGHHRQWKGVTMLEANFREAGRVAGEVMRGKEGGSVGDLLGWDEVAANKEALEGEKEEAVHVDKESVADAENPVSQGVRKVATEGNDPEPPQDDARQRSSAAPSTEINSSIVYLTSDSPHTLERLEPYTSYVIGGLVDRNREKGLCYRRAVEHGVRTAKLPIGEHMAMQSRFVLTTNQVVEIMAKWLDCRDWGAAFISVIPQRKGGVLKRKSETPSGQDGVELKDEDGSEMGEGL